MRIWEDDHYIKNDDSRELFISHGLAYIGVYHLRFSWKTTPEKNEAYLTRLHKLDGDAPARDRFLEENFLERNAQMRAVMEKIADSFPTHQFYKDERNIPYASGLWDLFFWCNHRKLSDGDHSDYTSFTLSLNNEYQTPEHRSEVLERLKDFLVDNFSELDSLYVAIQLYTYYFDDKIAAAAQDVIPKLSGVSCSWHGMDGKVVTTERGTFFKKKYARTRGYLLKDGDILRIAWKSGAC